MKKVIVFLLILTLFLGGIGFAHAAVTANQEALLIFPTLEVGDPAALEGLTASMTITCGPHLRWQTDYPFGGEAVTEFVYDRKGTEPPLYASENYLDIWLTGGMNSSVSGGEFNLNASEYGALLQTVAQETAAGESRTLELLMEDYVNHYLPDYELRYEDDTRQCHQSASVHSFITGEQWYDNPGCYVALMQSFRFPVQPGHIMSVSVTKDDAGRIVDIGLNPENGPELHFLSAVNSEGLWFVPVFRDETGAPLPYESPEGHGIYFIPWMHNDRYLWTEGQPEQVTPNVKKARLCYPLDEALRIEHMLIDPEGKRAQMLTLENGQYILTTCDLETGRETARLEIMACDPGVENTAASFLRDGEYLLLLLQGNIALTDAAGETLYLTAPDALEQRFNAHFYDADTGDLRFDGETLILTDAAWYQEGTFWTAAWRQGELRFYGEYDCSLMRSKDNWYYSYVTAEEYPIVLK